MTSPAPQPYAKVIAHSVAPDGTEVGSLQVRHWRPVLAEFNTHSFSRSSASMRAIPLAKQLAKIAEEGAARPALFRSKQKGMQGGEEVANVEDVISLWESAAEDAATWAQALDDLGVHKAIPNRLLEPFIMQTQIITSVNWQNFFDQRCSPLAEDNIRIPAEMMRDALAASTPKQLVRGDWHLPYVDDDDTTYAWDMFESTGESYDRHHVYLWLARLSAARCAQLSYLTQPVIDPETQQIVDPGGKIDREADIARYEKLMAANPKHWSPLEHPCTPCPENRQRGVLWVPSDKGDVLLSVDLTARAKTGKLVGWLPLRSIEEVNHGQDTYR